MKKITKHFRWALPMVIAALLLAGCGKSEPDPNSGMYEATSAEAFGMSMDPSELFADGISMELKDGGKAKFYLEGEDYSMKWELDGNSFHAKGSGAELDGTLEDGVLFLEDIMGMGVDMTFECDEIINGERESASGEDGDEGGKKDKKDKKDSAKGGVLQRLKDAKDGKDVYGAFADDGDDEYIDVDPWGGVDTDWDLEGDEGDGGDFAGGEVSEFAEARGLDSSWFGEGVADAKTLAEFYIWWGTELSSDEKKGMYDTYIDVLEEHMGCKPQDDMDDNDNLDRAEFKYETPEGDGKLLILMVREDGKWRPASLSPGGTVNSTIDELRGE